jgi:hypothetical protein
MGCLNDAIDKLNFINLSEYIFVETGTYHGLSAKKAYDVGFKKIYTIELQKHIFDIAKENLKNCFDRVNLYLGDSKIILPSIINENQNEKIIFWLDAHIDGGNYNELLTPKNIEVCPLHFELLEIKKSKRNDHIILIDDMRIIDSYGWGVNVSKSLLKQQLLQINPQYKFSFIDSGNDKNDIMLIKV